MLSALHEVLLNKCTNKYEDETNEKKIWDYVTTMMKDTNTDEVSRCWAEMLKILNVYMGLYFAMCMCEGNCGNIFCILKR